MGGKVREGKMVDGSGDAMRVNEWVVSHIWMSHVTHMNESCYTYLCIMSHIWMSHVTHECAMSQIWMSHITYQWVMSQMWMDHVTHTNKSYRTLGWFVSYILVLGSSDESEWMSWVSKAGGEGEEGKWAGTFTAGMGVGNLFFFLDWLQAL